MGKSGWKLLERLLGGASKLTFEQQGTIESDPYGDCMASNHWLIRDWLTTNINQFSGHKTRPNESLLYPTEQIRLEYRRVVRTGDPISFVFCNRWNWSENAHRRGAKMELKQRNKSFLYSNCCRRPYFIRSQTQKCKRNTSTEELRNRQVWMR
jgi:hypothetical protein